MRGTRAQRARQSAAFLKALRKTGNVTMAAEAAGVTRKTMDKRRARNPDLASEWDAAVAYSQAHLAAGGPAAPDGDGELTRGGEYTVRATRGRGIQVRRAGKGLLTAAGERTFLAHLAATANVRLAAAAAGIGWSAIYARRARSPSFAREMEAALAEGYERLELALLANAMESLEADGSDPGAWREDAGDLPEPLERMRVQDAMLLLRWRRKNIAEGRPHAGLRARPATEEETNRALEKVLRRIELRMARDGGRGDRDPYSK